MKKQTKKRLLREIAETILCAVIAAVMGYAAHCHIRDVIHRTFEDIRRVEWVKAAHYANEPSSETLGGGK